MTILLHMCCGPCTIYPATILRDEGYTLRGFFYNPNIHPFREFRQRLAAVESLAANLGLTVDYERQYGLREYLRKVVFHEQERCRLCYEMRLLPTVMRALATGADAFTTTLLYSRYQKHELICQQAEGLSRRFGVPFLYRDFRAGWQQGIDQSIGMGLYRQSYCGCIYSEQERYDKSLRRPHAKGE